MMPSYSLKIDVGGVVFGISFPTEALYKFFQLHYHSFASELPVSWEIILVVDPSLAASSARWLKHEGHITRFELATHAGYINMRTRQARVAVPTPSGAVLGLGRLMGFICLQELPRHHNALFMHGAGIVIEGQGYIFFGASGRGKSTVSRLADGVGEVLSDESVVVRLGCAGPELVSTPFWGSATPIERIRQVYARRVPLRAMFSLVHGSDFRLSRLHSAPAVMELLTSEKIATERVESAHAWLAMAQNVVEQVPVYRLEFLPIPQLWEFLKLNANT